MRQVSLSVIAGVLALTGLVLSADSAQAQHRNHHHHHHHPSYSQFSNHYLPLQFYQQAYQYQRQHYYGGCNDYGANAYYYQQPYYAAPYQSNYCQPAPNFSIGYQNRDFGIYFAR